MIRNQVNVAAAGLPLILSAIALAVVLANIVAGVAPQPDENASGHLWQLLMAAQLPLIALFIASSDRRHWHRMAAIVGVQVLAIAAASLPVWLAGY